MRRRRRGGSQWSVLLGGLMLWSCVASGPPVDLESMDPSQDQWHIAQYYSREAARLRQKSRDLYEQGLIYERLFGADSDWVSGARVLARSYEEAAIQHEQRADIHLELSRSRRAPGASPPDS
jgi:hypothetical protein